uniref:Uncharacterized protein n=1 Tax=Panagrellus redivivus TaxID=6233 RepID=A0A7E4VUD9_PANRE
MDFFHEAYMPDMSVPHDTVQRHLRAWSHTFLLDRDLSENPTLPQTTTTSLAAQCRFCQDVKVPCFV